MNWRPLTAESKGIDPCKTRDCKGIIVRIGKLGVCFDCRSWFKSEKVQHQHRTRKELTHEEVNLVLNEAKKESFFDYAALRTMAELGIRRASLVGQNDHRSHENPGMLIENLTPKGIYLYEKKKTEKVFHEIKPELRRIIDEIIQDRPCQICHRTYLTHNSKCDANAIPIFGPIFPRTTGWVWYRVRHYAEKAKIPDAKYIHPHSFRWWAGDTIEEQHGIKVASKFLGHKSVATTWSHYSHRARPEQLSQAGETLLSKLDGGS